MATPKVIIDLKDKIDLKDGVLVHGFPGPGLASAIAVNYAMDQLELPRIGSISSEAFPALAVIRDYIPGHPMRLYGRDGMMLLVSEMAPMDALARLITDNLISFMKENQMRMLICLEAIVQQQHQQMMDMNAPEALDVEGGDDGEPSTFVVASTEKLKKRLEGEGFELFKEGMITGVSGLLLSEGERLDIDVVCILTEANPMYPDARAATRIIEELNKLEDLDINLDKLNKQAQEIEEKVKDSLTQAQKYLESQQKQQAPSDRVVPAHMYG